MSEATDRLEQQERDLQFDAFDHDDGWRLGLQIASLARAAGNAVIIDIRRPGLGVFRASLPGIAPDLEDWVRRKAALVFRMEASSALVEARLADHHIEPEALGLLRAEYAVTGGSFPIRVRGVGVVAAATVSGLESQGDHDLVVAGIKAYFTEGSLRPDPVALALD